MRPRKARREAERDAEKLARDRVRLAALEVGGSPARPEEIGSAALVEPIARALRCLVCDGELALEEHAAEAGLRVAQLQCRRCGARRSRWFRIAQPS